MRVHFDWVFYVPSIRIFRRCFGRFMPSNTVLLAVIGGTMVRVSRSYIPYFATRVRHVVQYIAAFCDVYSLQFTVSIVV